MLRRIRHLFEARNKDVESLIVGLIGNSKSISRLKQKMVVFKGNFLARRLN